MAFLDNSGDIILDAVLTDTGRARLAKGDGTFKIVKFALADDEIDYNLYDSSHASGSAYYDLEIMQTPLLEAFTNNTSLMKHRLISLPRTNLLFLPEMKINTSFEAGTNTVVFVPAGGLAPIAGTFICAADKATEDLIYTRITDGVGVLKGENPSAGARIRVDQGLNTTEIPPSKSLDPDLVETSYIVQVDNRFAKIVDTVNFSQASVSYIDDDNIASYYFSFGSDVNYVHSNEDKEENAQQVIRGPRGTFLQFKLESSLEINTSTHLFTTLGGGSEFKLHTADDAMYYVDSHIRITGATTGRSVDIPVRFAKKKIT
tara:strand:+ start:95 stop:1045 length:951 start_codon:yes stop_codon:yes gene_type:complete